MIEDHLNFAYTDLHNSVKSQTRTRSLASSNYFTRQMSVHTPAGEGLTIKLSHRTVQHWFDSNQLSV